MRFCSMRSIPSLRMRELALFCVHMSASVTKLDESDPRLCKSVCCFGVKT